ncbi:hypothetical protein ANANG_G00131840 [Anguilla anguilla]|uniref:Uncharacterized protein n=1 Tax=Anguilla anguilla TaxID=7936 RepID=A0A9D3S2L4_ANGAN|nr:hypothetical protein ANANG_G00131840 [Anguilla anguilla]
MPYSCPSPGSNGSQGLGSSDTAPYSGLHLPVFTHTGELGMRKHRRVCMSCTFIHPSLGRGGEARGVGGGGHHWTHLTQQACDWSLGGHMGDIWGQC